MPTACLVCVMPVSRILSRYFSTSFTGSTGGLDEMKITVEQLDRTASSHNVPTARCVRLAIRFQEVNP